MTKKMTKKKIKGGKVKCKPKILTSNQCSKNIDGTFGFEEKRISDVLKVKFYQSSSRYKVQSKISLIPPHIYLYIFHINKSILYIIYK